VTPRVFRLLRADLEELLNHFIPCGHVPRTQLGSLDAPGLREALAPHGVIVRDCANFGLPGVVRIAVPND